MSPYSITTVPQEAWEEGMRLFAIYRTSRTREWVENIILNEMTPVWGEQTAKVVAEKLTNRRSWRHNGHNYQ